MQECTVGTDIEQFLAVPCPEWSRPARRRDWRLAAADVRKWPDVDFERARTVGVVRNPPAVGETIPLNFSNFVCSSGVTPRVPLSANCMRSFAIVDVCSLKRTAVPSGVIAVGNWLLLLVVSRSASLPSVACHQRLRMAPPRFEAKIIRWLLGVHTGNRSRPGSSVRRVSVARARCAIQMSSS